MNGLIQNKCNKYSEIYELLYKKIKWKVSSGVINLIVISYMINNKEFDYKYFMEVSDYIKVKSEKYSPLRYQDRYILASLLISRYDNPKGKFDQLLNIQNELIKYGFKKDSKLSLNSFALLDMEDKSNKVIKSINIYSKVKNYYPSLVNIVDYTPIILLAKKREKTHKIIKNIKSIHDKLLDQGFYESDELRFLSYILARTNTWDIEGLIKKCGNILYLGRNNGFRFKTLYYPLIGLMAIGGIYNYKDIKDVREILYNLKESKNLRWTHEYNMVVAVMIKIIDALDGHNVIKKDIGYTIEFMKFTFLTTISMNI
ncbi:DUF4003 family protein [Dethiothermospora halolimnae]|uniref:DUF4003 family protein n=1 Tax=Dethiothermospora halolimnae TaxID=3114390 RepID=UPI003CCB8BE8